MQTNLIIKEIENKYPVEDIISSGIPVCNFCEICMLMNWKFVFALILIVKK